MSSSFAYAYLIHWVGISKPTINNRYIIMKIRCTGLTITTNSDIVRDFEILTMDCDEIVTTCGHVIDLWSGDMNVTSANGRRVMNTVSFDVIK